MMTKNNKVVIEEWVNHNTQMSCIGNHRWSVARLIYLSASLPVMKIPLIHLDLSDSYDNLRLRAIVTHFKAMMAADLSKPIIIDEDGELMDGQHRIMKALYEGRETILAVRFVKNPTPCEVIRA